MKFDLSTIPFSRYGALVSITENKETGELIINNVRKKWGLEKLLVISFTKDSKRIKPKIYGEPHCIKVKYNEDEATIYIRDDEDIIIESNTINITIKIFEGLDSFGYKENEGVFKLFSSLGQASINVIAIQGIIKAEFVRVVEGQSQINKKTALYIEPYMEKSLIHIKISEIEKKAEKYDIDTIHDLDYIKLEWDKFHSKMISVSNNKKATAEVLWYVLWSSFVRANGNFKYDTMLVSKGRMAAIWSGIIALMHWRYQKLI